MLDTMNARFLIWYSIISICVLELLLCTCRMIITLNRYVEVKRNPDLGLAGRARLSLVSLLWIAKICTKSIQHCAIVAPIKFTKFCLSVHFVWIFIWNLLRDPIWSICTLDRTFEDYFLHDDGDGKCDVILSLSLNSSSRPQFEWDFDWLFGLVKSLIDY